MPQYKSPTAGQPPLLIEKRAQERIVCEIDCSNLLDNMDLFNRAELSSDAIEVKTSRGTTLIVTINPTETYTTTDMIANVKLLSVHGSIRIVPLKVKVYP